MDCAVRKRSWRRIAPPASPFRSRVLSTCSFGLPAQSDHPGSPVRHQPLGHLPSAHYSDHGPGLCARETGHLPRLPATAAPSATPPSVLPAAPSGEATSRKKFFMAGPARRSGQGPLRLPWFEANENPRPGPRPLQAKVHATRSTGDPRRDMEKALAQALGLPEHGLAPEAEPLHPDQQVLGGEHEL